MRHRPVVHALVICGFRAQRLHYVDGSPLASLPCQPCQPREDQRIVEPMSASIGDITTKRGTAQRDAVWIAAHRLARVREMNDKPEDLRMRTGGFCVLMIGVQPIQKS